MPPSTAARTWRAVAAGGDDRLERDGRSLCRVRGEQADLDPRVDGDRPGLGAPLGESSEVDPWADYLNNLQLRMVASRMAGGPLA